MTTAAPEATPTMTVVEAGRLIRETFDPLSSSAEKLSERQKLKCDGNAVRVFEPDPDGIREVLYMAPGNEPMTAYFRGKTVISIGEGW